MKKFGLTMRQLRVLNFIRDTLAKSEVAPSLQEICAACDMKHKSRAHYALRELKRRGHIDFLPWHPRSVTLVTPNVPKGSAPRGTSESEQPSPAAPSIEGQPQ